MTVTEAIAQANDGSRPLLGHERPAADQELLGACAKRGTQQRAEKHRPQHPGTAHRNDMTNPTRFRMMDLPSVPHIGRNRRKSLPEARTGQPSTDTSDTAHV